jgi:peptidoglycan hydrolase-like protein with peptidoglycan-binding domain
MQPRDLQQALNLLGYQVGGIDGVLGSQTRGALLRFQTDVGLPADGRHGPRTDAALSDLVGRLASALAAPQAPGHLSRFRLTQYVIAEEPAKGKAIVPVLDAQGQVLARVDARFFCDLALQGSGRLRDGRLLNVTGQYVDARDHDEYASVLATAQRVLSAHVGYAGIKVSGGIVTSALAFARVPGERAGKGFTIQRGIACDPFRTLAADLGAYSTSEPRFRGRGGLVPAGTRVFILELAGVKLPDGSTHDGWCVVNDTGGAIYGAHFDVFAGTRALLRQVRLPRIGHAWFEGSEARCPRDYSYGL